LNEKRSIENSIQKNRVLETYVLNFTYFALLTLVRQCKKHEAGGKEEIPFSQLSEDTSIQTMGSSIESFERQGIDGLIDEENPEMILMGKELMEMAGRSLRQQ
jgi:hypothetical protein